MNEITREIKRRGRILDHAARDQDLTPGEVAEAIFTCISISSDLAARFTQHYTDFTAPAQSFAQAVNVARICARNLMVMAKADDKQAKLPYTAHKETTK